MDSNGGVLDIMGQQPALNLYTGICLCYPVPDGSSNTTIVNTLNNGLKRLSDNFPWVAGQVVNEGASQDSTGIFKIKPLERIPRLVIKDLSNDLATPSMDAMRQASFPFRMVDENVIAPRRTIPGFPEESTSEIPVYGVQATFIKGGLLLTFVGQHQVMDMTGQGSLMHLLSKACHNEPFTEEELEIGNMDRENIIPLLEVDTEQIMQELASQIDKPSHPAISEPEQSTPQGLPTSSWHYFAFSSTKLAALKSAASETLPPESEYISTDDALCALIWQSIIRVRLPRFSPTHASTFARAVDTRRYLNVPQTYPGIIQYMAYNTLTLQEVADAPLGVIASKLRKEVDPKTSKLARRTRALATFLHHSADKRAVSFTSVLDLSTDIMLSSWAKIDCFSLDFNLGLGKPESVRRPRFIPVESLLYLLPRTPDGELALAICLRDQDMARLIADEKFVNYARHIE